MKKRYYIKVKKEEIKFPSKFCEGCGRKIPDPNPQFTNYYNWDKRRYCSLKCRNIINRENSKKIETRWDSKGDGKKFPLQQEWEIKKLKELKEIIEKRLKNKRR